MQHRTVCRGVCLTSLLTILRRSYFSVDKTQPQRTHLCFWKLTNPTEGSIETGFPSFTCDGSYSCYGMASNEYPGLLKVNLFHNFIFFVIFILIIQARIHFHMAVINTDVGLHLECLPQISSNLRLI